MAEKPTITFDPVEHTYTTQDGVRLPSVTQILQRQNIAPSYAGVKSDVLRKAAEYGNLVHDEIDTYVKNGEEGFTQELFAFIEWCKNHNAKFVASEYVVWTPYYAGKGDLIIELDGEYIFIDHKTTSKIHHEAVCWQTSLYHYGAVSVGIVESDKPARGAVFHYKRMDDGSVELETEFFDFKSADAIKDFLDTDAKGELYNQGKFIPSSTLIEISTLKEAIEGVEAQKKELEVRLKELQESVMGLMQANGTTKIDYDEMSLTIVSKKGSSTFDKDAFKKAHPELENEMGKFVKTSKPTTYLSVTIKKKEEK